MPTKQEQMWDAFTDVQCAEGRRRNSAIVRNKSGWHIAFNKKKKLFSEYTPKVAERTRPQDLEQCGEHGMLNLDTEQACLQTFQPGRWKRNAIILNFKSYKNQLNTVHLFFSFGLAM